MIYINQTIEQLLDEILELYNNNESKQKMVNLIEEFIKESK